MGVRCIIGCYLNQIAIAVVFFNFIFIVCFLSSELVEGVLELNVLCK